MPPLSPKLSDIRDAIDRAQKKDDKMKFLLSFLFVFVFLFTMRSYDFM